VKIAFAEWIKNIGSKWIKNIGSKWIKNIGSKWIKNIGSKWIKNIGSTSESSLPVVATMFCFANIVFSCFCVSF
jgi:hypothetical protein